MSTYSATPSEVEHKWYLIDAKGAVLGRLAALVATRLRGKHKPMFTPHIDCGDHIVVVNAEKVALTGNKLEGKRHYWHTGYPGGIKSKPLGEVLEDSASEAIKSAVKGMLPKSKLGREMFSKLKVYDDSEHPHAAQNPQLTEI